MRPVALPEMLPGPLRGALEIWRLDLNLDSAVPAFDWDLLDAQERHRASRFAKAADRVRYVRTRAALRRLLGQRMGVQGGQVRLSRRASGKPGLDDTAAAAGPGLEFNVSHAGTHALIALSAGAAVGIDIECCDPAIDCTALEPMVLSPWERQEAHKDSLDFFERWVIKEAVLKAVGVGVAEHLPRLSVASADAQGEGRYRLSHQEHGWPVLGAWRLDAPQGYRAALSCVLSASSSS